MDEQAYKCQGALSEYADDLTCYIDKAVSDDPGIAVLHGRSRKSGRKFTGIGTVGREHVMEDCAIALLKSELGEQPYPCRLVLFVLEGKGPHCLEDVIAKW